MVIIKTLDSHLDNGQGTLFVRQWIPKNCDHLPPLILLHDSLGSVELWKDFPDRLATALNRTIVAYDRSGFGQSSARNDKLSANFVEVEAKTVVPLLCEALKLTDFLILGHSVGGAMALSVAAFNSNCKAVVSISTQAFVEERTRNGIRDARESFRDPAIFNKLEKWHQGKSKWVLDAWTETWLSEEFASWNIIAELQRVSCPVLVIHGDQDEYGSLAFPETIVKSTSGTTELEIYEGCGHVPHREQPEKVVESVLRFIKRNIE